MTPDIFQRGLVKLLIVSSDAILDDDDVVIAHEGVSRGRFDADIGGHAGQKDNLHAFNLQ